MLKEATQYADRTARFLRANKPCARDERSDVACSCGAGNLGFRGFEQGVGNEFAEEKVREGSITRREPEEKKLCIARLEGTEDRTGEDCEEGVKLC